MNGGEIFVNADGGGDNGLVLGDAGPLTSGTVNRCCIRRVLPACSVHVGSSGSISVENVYVMWHVNGNVLVHGGNYVVSMPPQGSWKAFGVYGERDDYNMDPDVVASRIEAIGGSASEALDDLLSSASYKKYIFPVLVASGSGDVMVVDRGPFEIKEEVPPGAVAFWIGDSQIPYGWSELSFSEPRMIITNKGSVGAGGEADVGAEYDFDDCVVSRIYVKGAAYSYPYAVPVSYKPTKIKRFSVKLIKKK